MADMSIPLSFLSGSNEVSAYPGTLPITNVLRGISASQDLKRKRAAEVTASERADAVRSALASALEQGVDLETAAKAVAKYDPDLAYRLMQEFRKEKEDASKSANAGQPNVIRQQLRMARDQAYEAANNTALSQTVRSQAAKELAILTEEMAKPYPNAQSAYERINAIYGGAPSNIPAGGTGGGATYDNLLSTINSTLAGIQFKGAELDSAVSSLTDQVNTSGLEKASKDELLTKIKDIAGTKKAKVDEVGAEVKGWLAKFLSSYDPKALGAKVKEAKDKLVAAIGEYKNGNYATANLRVFKEVMGAMSAPEYGIASNSQAASVLSTLPIVGEGFAQAIAVDKFNSPEDARARINEAIKSFNTFVSGVTSDALVPSEIDGQVVTNRPEKVKALAQDGSYQAFRSMVGKEIPLLGGAGGTSNPKPSTIIPAGKKEGDVWEDQYFMYRIRNGELNSKRK